MKESLKQIKIKSIRKIGVCDRYDLTVPETSNFFANGILVHNSNLSMGRVLCKRPLSLIEKILKKLGVKIEDKQYDLVYASRTVIKNSYADKEHNHYYEVDIWKIMADKYAECLKNGISVFAEIVGQLPNGAPIQRDYAYGIPDKRCEMFVFRMTYTSPSGDVFEFSTPQMQKYCAKMGMKTVPIFYYGKASGLYPELNIENHWHENFLNNLIRDYTEKKCFMCQNNVPEEGIVLSVEGETALPLKLKSSLFLLRETKELDKGESNIEDAA